MTTEQVAVGLGIAAVLLSAFAALFSFRADRAARDASRKADRRWDDTIRPQPSFTFVAPPSPGQGIEIEVQNMGGTLAAGAVIATYGDDLFASEMTLPEKAPPRRVLLPPVMKAWKKAPEPAFLMVAGRDVSGRWWDCLNGAVVIKDPHRWLGAHLKALRLEGAVNFPELSGPPPGKK